LFPEWKRSAVGDAGSAAGGRNEPGLDQLAAALDFRCVDFLAQQRCGIVRSIGARRFQRHRLGPPTGDIEGLFLIDKAFGGPGAGLLP